MPKDLYSLRKIVSLTYTGSGANNVNMPWGGFGADFVVNKGVYSDLEFTIRDLDRKPIPLQGKTLLLRVINEYNEELVFEKNMVVIDPYKARAKVTLLPADTATVDKGFYRYIVIMTNEDGSYYGLQVDYTQKSYGFIEVSDRLLPQPSYTYTVTEFTPTGDYVSQEFYSSAFPSPNQLGYSDNLSTATFTMDDFSGTITMEGSIDSTPTEESGSWYEIEITSGDYHLTYSHFTGMEAYNVISDSLWYRFKYQPDIGSTGTVTRIEYRP